MRFGQSLPSKEQPTDAPTKLEHQDVEPFYQPDPHEVWKIKSRMGKLGFNYSDQEIINQFFNQQQRKK
jgi:hypothetical protein